ncbi:DUF4410 domain-containing protein [Pelotalea chapellei]|uniref:DUF4410 domain-containing protein n=1 Tax=Pelotalea chapellei TaxID=44671 RepID=A0ABS5U740_9BACT|nr:DUF4410 domain-containing protein [Pelotalea chapellei]MBT1071487.1 DUF4410 domain-containing protein [Pelotalea chapellei]
MKRLLMGIMLMFSTAVAGFAGDATLPKPDVLGEENVLLTEKLSANYDTFIVRDFTTEGAEIANMNDEEKAKLNEVKPEIIKALTESAVKYVKKETGFKNVVSNTAPKGKAVILEGKFTKFNAGHGAAKFFLGWMAPEGTKTNISVKGRLIDAKTGKELATFSDTRSGGEGSTMGFVGYVFKVQAKDEGEEIANFVKKLY